MSDKRTISRNKILKSAEKLFANSGFHATEVEQIAKNAGVAKGTIYNYFNNKEDILFSVIEKGIDDLNEKMKEGTCDILTAEEKVRKGIEIYVEHLVKNIPLFRIFHGERIHFKCDLETRYYEKLFSRVTHVEELIKEASRKGEFKDIDPYLAAASLIGMMEFVIYRMVLDGKKIDKDFVTGQVRNLYLQGLLSNEKEMKV